MALEAEEERQFPVRRYQNRNLRDLDFPIIDEAPSETSYNGGRVPSLLPYFTKTSKYCTSAVLEESVIDNEMLKQTALLKSFDPRFVEEMLKVEGCTRAIVYLPDMEISHQGDKADSLVVIVRGQVEAFVDGVLQKRLTAGDYFGEREFLGVTSERAATAVAVTFCDARVMYRSCLSRTLNRCPAMKEDLPYMISIWNRKSERDALRFMKVFTEKCMECMESVDMHVLDASLKDSGAVDAYQKQLSARAASNSSTLGGSPRDSQQRSGTEGLIIAPTSPRSGTRSGTSGSTSLRKIGQAPLKAGRAIGIRSMASY